MTRQLKNQTVILAMIIAIAIIIVSIFSILVASNVIVNSENHSAKERTEMLISEVMAQYGDQGKRDLSAYTLFSDDNVDNIVLFSSGDTIEDIYINLNRTDLHEPLADLPAELDSVFGESTRDMVSVFCNKNGINYETCKIADIDSAMFIDLVESLQKETGVR